MALLGYTMFRDEVLTGKKRQTIRRLRKRPIRKGEQLYHYWHLRRKDCEEIGTSFCRETFFITISGWPGEWRIDRHNEPSTVSGRTMLDDEALDLAKRDGFRDVASMVEVLSMLHGKDALDGKTVFQVVRW